VFQLLFFRQFDVIDSLPNPFVPIHSVLGVKFDAAELHVNVLVEGEGVSGEEVEIVGVYFPFIFEDGDGQSELQYLVRFGNVFELCYGQVTFWYFSKGRRLMRSL
jgi:hypothetical protein